MLNLGNAAQATPEEILFPRYANEEIIAPEVKCFWKKVRNFFCFSEAKNVFATNVHVRANGETFTKTLFRNSASLSAGVFTRTDSNDNNVARNVYAS